MLFDLVARQRAFNGVFAKLQRSEFCRGSRVSDANKGQEYLSRSEKIGRKIGLNSAAAEEYAEIAAKASKSAWEKRRRPTLQHGTVFGVLQYELAPDVKEERASEVDCESASGVKRARRGSKWKQAPHRTARSSSLPSDEDSSPRVCNYFTCQRYCSPCGFNRTKLASDWGAGKRGKLIGKFLELTIAFVICIYMFFCVVAPGADTWL